MVKLWIELCDDRKPFTPGGTIEGEIKILNKKKIACKDLCLRSVGTSMMKGDYTILPKLYDSTTHLPAGNIFRWDLLPGLHSYKFRLALPPDVPPSFESKNCSVNHICYATLTIEGLMGPRIFTCKAPFHVVFILDLNNTEAKAKKPITEVAEKYCGSFRAEYMSLLVNSSRSGYIPGDHIDINAVCNTSHKKPLTARVELIKEVTLLTQKKCEIDEEVINSTFTNFKNERERMSSFIQMKLHVPYPLTPSGSHGELINVQYKLKFKIMSYKRKVHLQTSSPLIIGSIPLKNNFTINPGDCFERNIEVTSTAFSTALPTPPLNTPSVIPPTASFVAPPVVVPSIETPTAPPMNVIVPDDDFIELPPSYESIRESEMGRLCHGVQESNCPPSRPYSKLYPTLD